MRLASLLFLAVAVCAVEGQSAWTSQGNSPTDRRHSGGTAVLQDKVYLLAGGTIDQQSSDFSSYSPFSQNWESLDPPPWQSTGRTGVGLAAWGSSLFAFGGTEDGSVFSDMYRYLDAVWTEVQMVSPPGARFGHGFTTLGNYIYMLGGFDSSVPVAGELHRFDPSSSEWSKVELANSGQESPLQRAWFGFTAFGSELFAFGGTTSFSGGI